MEKKKIIKIYKDKLELLNKYNKSYFDKNKSLVSDQVFDELKHEVLNLENQYNFLKNKEKQYQHQYTLYFSHFPMSILLNPFLPSLDF